MAGRTGPPPGLRVNMKLPILKNFKNKVIRYKSFKTDSYEIRLIACNDGYDVAMYDLDNKLIYSPECTCLHPMWHSLEAYKAAADIYMRMIQTYEHDRLCGLPTKLPSKETT